MKPILTIEDIDKLKMDEKLIECIAGKVNYYRFLCFHPRNSNFVILLNHCAFNGCSACVEIMADDDNGVSMMHYIDYEDIIGVELIKN
jgi:hypothetical protein